MCKFDKNAVFFSKRNPALSYEIKKALLEYNIDVTYAISFSELISIFKEAMVEMVFIDKTSCDENLSVLDFIKNFHNDFSPIVIYILSNGEEEPPLKCKNKISFFLTEENFRNDYKKIKYQLDILCANQKANKYDFKQVSNFLTDYLLKLGIAPKHIGFMYIKQAIEVALNNNESIGSLSKDIYPKVATINKTVHQNVERNIRNAIDCALKYSNNCDDEFIALSQNGKISNRTFLTYVLDKVKNRY